MTNVKQQLHNMYIGLVFTYWANEDTKMGTAKQKALQQMHSYSKTINKQNPIAREINSNVADMNRAISKQIMTDKSSELVLDKNQAAQYKSFGTARVAQSKQELNKIIERANKSWHIDRTQKQIKAEDKLTQLQDVKAKQNASQYRALGTNVAAKAPKPMEQKIMDQKTLMRILMQKRMQNVA